MPILSIFSLYVSIFLGFYTHKRSRVITLELFYVMYASASLVSCYEYFRARRL